MENREEKKRTVSSHIVISVLAIVLGEAVASWFIRKQGYVPGDMITVYALRIIALIEALIGLVCTVTGISAVRIRRGIGIVIIIIGVLFIFAAAAVFFASDGLEIVIM